MKTSETERELTTEYAEHPYQFRTSHSNQTNPSNDAKMTEVFCQLLTAEIEKIKAESSSQVSAMRDQYSNELKALREEFMAREEKVMSKQASFKTATLHHSQHESQASNSQALIEELRNVKAERDLYYKKLVTVKEKLQHSTISKTMQTNSSVVQIEAPKKHPFETEHSLSQKCIVKARIEDSSPLTVG
jgi:hypothetical protein